MIDRRRAEEGVIEIASGNPFAVEANLAGRDHARTLFNGGNVDGAGAVGEAMLLRLDERIEGTEEVVERARQSGVACDGGLRQQAPIRPA